MIVLFDGTFGRFRTTIGERINVRKRPAARHRGPFPSDFRSRVSLPSEQPWVCHDLACASLRGVSQVFDALPCRLQSLSERVLSGSARNREIPGVDLVLCVRHPAQAQPLEGRRDEGLPGFQPRSPARLWPAGGDCANPAADAWITLNRDRLFDFAQGRLRRPPHMVISSGVFFSSLQQPSVSWGTRGRRSGRRSSVDEAD